MVVDAHSMREELAHLNEMDGPRFKIEKDPRVTRVGRVLRRFSIDELPQFYSVFKGDMSLVGPRPFPIEEVMAYERYQHRRLGMKPGLTGPWQIGGRCDLKTFDEMFEMDEDYIQHWSLWLDVTILLKTIPSVLFGKGAM
jgi:lipopolysaccharide/colanic/teichoic acid biosynthesis glycosyltransferase